MVPEDGDIVVQHEHRDGRERFVLRTAPGMDQIVVRSRTAALDQAIAFARRLQVRVWLVEGSHNSFTLIANFREGGGDDHRADS